MPIDPNQMMPLGVAAAAANPRAPDRYAGWTNADWDQELRRMMDTVSRRTQDRDATGGMMPPRQEFLFEGNWMNEQEFNDPEWRRNVYDPWAQGVHDEWRNKREDWDRRPRESSPFERREPNRQRGAGSMGSYSSGGGGGRSSGGMGSRSSRRQQYDPAMIAQLIGG
jgi:uncharacterized membrane protein YgcG